MVLKQFREGINEYGLVRLFTEWDFLLSLFFVSVIVSFRYLACPWVLKNCFSLYNPDFVSLATKFAISLTAFILAGLAVIISFTDRQFLVQLKKLEIYANIMFVFQFNLYLSGLTALVGILVSSVYNSELAFVLFLFFFIYLMLSLAAMVDLIVQYGIQKANYEESR